MGQKKVLNKKRLTRKQVQEIIDTEGNLHEEYTKFFEEKYVTGHVERDKVYELPGDRFLYVFDENGISLPGKGDIYSRENFLRRIIWTKRVRDDYPNKRGSSVDHWLFYSKHKNDFVEHIQELTSELSVKLKIDQQILDNSYKSLDAVSNACNFYELDELFETLYDNLVAYVGEVIKTQINGHWDNNKTHSGGLYPFISIGLKRVQYMPINAVWSATSGLDIINFRQEAANEVRSNGFRAKFEKEYNNLFYSNRD